MAYTNINKSSDYFNTKLWTGNSSTQSITGNNFIADLTWSKTRSNAESHILMDTVRDAGTTLNQALFSNSSNAEGTLNNSSTLTVNSTGFDLSGTTGGALNYNGYTYATWLWRAGGHTGSSNTDGDITSTVSANTTSGFSIVKYTGTGANATIGHGLGVAPSIVLCKNLSASGNWIMYHSTEGATKYMVLNATDAVATATGAWNDTAPTSSVFSVGTGSTVNGSGNNLVAYCFAEKTGFNKFGSYTGNGNADGTFVYTGFKPAFIILRGTNAENWLMLDNKRDPINVADDLILPNQNIASFSATYLDMVSNGFKIRTNAVGGNASGQEYIYLAFAEAPLVGSNNVPCTAR